MLRKRFIFIGTVQGVGMRPWLYNTAVKHALTGHVKNTTEAVECEAQGHAQNIEKFLAALKKTPPQIKIDEIKIKNLKVKKEKCFIILKSEVSKKTTQLLPPDIALCAACAREIADPKNRRYNYPLTNCSYCGPRYTIAKKMPYDRKNTTMSAFKMCPACLAEYKDPRSRRFHAEPNCCPACGPVADVSRAARALTSGQITAIKSIGGFHLACDALNKRAVLRLRKQKARPDKPFTLMFSSLAAAKKYCFVNKKEAALLTGPAAPIVLLKKKKNIPYISDNLNTYGVMLPYTALHKVLFNLYGAGPLVMTSANESNEAIISDARQVQAEVIISHDREIYNRIDDSLVFECNGGQKIMRYARGLAGRKIKIHNPKNKTILAYGAEMTGGFCLVKGNYAYLSQYLGDLKEPANQKFYLETLKKTQKFLDIKPKFFARDAHPQYFTSTLAPRQARPVPHHAAHAMAVAAEHNIKEPYLAIVYDGLGYGEDGTIWGGEFLAFTKKKHSRAAHFISIPMLGLDGEDLSAFVASYLPEYASKTHKRFLENKINTPLCSSVGRLFDAAACLAGLRTKTTYQAQAAMELESLVKTLRVKPYSYTIKKENAAYIIDPRPMLKEIINTKETKQKRAERFHKTLVDITAKTAGKIGLKTIVLAGGVFQNKVLLSALTKELQKQNFKVYTNLQTPLSDGCIALGQAAALL